MGNAAQLPKLVLRHLLRIDQLRNWAATQQAAQTLLLAPLLGFSSRRKSNGNSLFLAHARMLLLLIADVAANRFLTVALFEWHLLSLIHI